jgi:hypothetical protein
MSEIPRVAVRSVAAALLLMAFFTLVWVAWVFPAVPDGIALAIAIPFELLAVLFAVQGVVLFSRSKLFPVVPTADRRGQTKRVGLRFGLIFGIEGVLIGATSGILFATGLDAYLAPAIALIVGAHFIPLARVFERTIDYWVAAWVIAVALAGIIAIAVTPAAPAFVSALVGIGTAAGTSAYGIYLLGVKRSLLRQGDRR